MKGYIGFWLLTLVLTAVFFWGFYVLINAEG
jgi:hypothetical protein